VLGTTAVLAAVAIRAYDPSRALMQRKG